jgi:hypothetical protein
MRDQKHIAAIRGALLLFAIVCIAGWLEQTLFHVAKSIFRLSDAVLGFSALACWLALKGYELFATSRRDETQKLFENASPSSDSRPLNPQK